MNAELQAALDTFKNAVHSFAKKSVVEEYDPRLHDATDATGHVEKDVNPHKTLVHGEESLVGHVDSALDNAVVPHLEAMQGEPAPAEAAPSA